MRLQEVTCLSRRQPINPSQKAPPLPTAVSSRPAFPAYRLGSFKTIENCGKQNKMFSPTLAVSFATAIQPKGKLSISTPSHPARSFLLLYFILAPRPFRFNLSMFSCPNVCMRQAALRGLYPRVPFVPVLSLEVEIPTWNQGTYHPTTWA